VCVWLVVCVGWGGGFGGCVWVVVVVGFLWVGKGFWGDMFELWTRISWAFPVKW